MSVTRQRMKSGRTSDGIIEVKLKKCPCCNGTGERIGGEDGTVPFPCVYCQESGVVEDLPTEEPVNPVDDDNELKLLPIALFVLAMLALIGGFIAKWLALNCYGLCG